MIIQAFEKFISSLNVGNSKEKMLKKILNSSLLIQKQILKKAKEMPKMKMVENSQFEEDGKKPSSFSFRKKGNIPIFIHIKEH